MRRHKIVLAAFLVAIAAMPEAANAQFSPGGLVGAVTHPLRALLGRLGHFPHGHRSAAAQESQSTTQAHATPPAPAQLGTVGPTAWPTAFEDAIGYAFWPGEYAEQIRARGFDVIAGTLVGTARVPEIRENRDDRHRSRQRRTECRSGKSMYGQLQRSGRCNG